MKTFLPTLLCVAAVFGLSVAADAQLSDFQLRVQQKSKTDAKKAEKTQSRTLTIFVSSSSRQPADLVAKYAFIARDVKSHNLVRQDEGEKAVSVASMGTVTVETETATSNYADAHSEKGGKGKGGKKVEASGEKLIGYGVRLFQGDKLVAEYYDPPSAKEAWGGAPGGL